MIASGLSIGISKRELLTEYYYDELLEVFAEYGVLHAIDSEDKDEEDYSENLEAFFTV